VVVRLNFERAGKPVTYVNRRHFPAFASNRDPSRGKVFSHLIEFL
jgi:hypothetical protein